MLKSKPKYLKPKTQLRRSWSSPQKHQNFAEFLKGKIFHPQIQEREHFVLPFSKWNISPPQVEKTFDLKICLRVIYGIKTLQQSNQNVSLDQILTACFFKTPQFWILSGFFFNSKFQHCPRPTLQSFPAVISQSFFASLKNSINDYWGELQRLCRDWSREESLRWFPGQRLIPAWVETNGIHPAAPCEQLRLQFLLPSS